MAGRACARGEVWKRFIRVLLRVSRNDSMTAWSEDLAVQLMLTSIPICSRSACYPWLADALPRSG